MHRDRSKKKAPQLLSGRLAVEIFEAAPDGILLIGKDGRIVWTNKRIEEMLGYRREQLVGRGVEMLVPESRRAAHRRSCARYSREPKVMPMGGTHSDFCALHSGGREIPVDVSLSPVDTSSGPVFITIVRDVTERKAAESALQGANRALSVINHTNQAIARASDETGLLHQVCGVMVSAGGYRLAWFGIALDDAAKTVQPVAQAGYEAGYLESVDITWADTERGRGPTGAAIRTRRPVIATNILTDPTYSPWRSEALKRGYQSSASLPLIVEGRPLGALNIYAAQADAFGHREMDLLTKMGDDLAYGLESIRRKALHKKAREQIERLACYDRLTDLPNRQLFEEHLGQSLAYAKRNRQMLALLAVNLDKFARINEAMGYTVGDMVLKAVAGRLRDTLSEVSTVGRTGSDEFYVLLPPVTRSQAAGQAARVVVEELSRPLEIHGQDIPLSASVGVSLYPLDGEDPAALLAKAGAALRRAKERGGRTYEFYKESMQAFSADRLALEKNLGDALEHGEIVPYYQPIVDLKTGQINGCEALARWLRSGREVLEPASFIGLAEETGLINRLGERMLRLACAQARAWQKAGFELYVSVNLSTRQLSQDNLSGLVAGVLAETGLDPSRLQLEITETGLLEGTHTTIPLLNKLIADGIAVAIDDFGTGYSSLSYLTRLPISNIKIDCSFVSDIDRDHEKAAIVRAIVSMARNLRLGVVAEGVETSGQRKFLRGIKTPAAQGFYFSRPLPARDFDRLLGRA
jgi:diguanylate cyclase (GGDEF)-like protein/PAS domain S-box-containing protein